MRRIITFCLLTAVLISIASCSDTDTETQECLETEILMKNQCEQDISVSYFELDDGFNLIDELLNLDGCDIVEKNRIIPPGSTTEIVVFEGACDMDWENGVDGCAGFESDEVVSVQYIDKVKEYPIVGKNQIIINPSDFDE